MNKKRLIPCLDTRDGKVVKGVHFVDVKDVGDPAELAKRYTEEGADELVVLDITAGTEGRATRLDVLKRVCAVTDLPVTQGGGMTCLADIDAAMAAGATRVGINSAAVKNPDLLRQGVEKYGKDAIVAAIDAKEVDGSWHVFVGGGLEDTGKELLAWAKEVETLGVGAILLTSIDADGTKAGYDIPMTRAVTEAVSIPVIASGGAGKVQDIIDVLKESDCEAALAASVFHFGEMSVGEIKAALKEEGLDVY
ncbi:MAG: HisA/HisF-related TIM barrel protein [Clostridia bacterium]|nr:HisA/HisF-related TIM barrel protein [Clostridiales bacterium]MDU7505086.1 HisA/HisF-related TIM barrel protein [Clostridia bacterium]